ncbi:MAG: hypothetical protein RL398_292 [Planctomycetota bacterium]
MLLAACGGESREVRSFGGPTMGSTYQIKYVGDADPGELRPVVEAELAAFDKAFSNWRQDSEIAAVNAHRSTEPLPLSPLFAAVLGEALRIAAATDGAFDPTVKPLSDVFRAAKKDPEHRLDPVALAAAKALVDWRGISLRDGALVKARPEQQIDLDGIVAGAACDAIAARLTALGVIDAYIEVTGEVLCRGAKAPGTPWRIGVVDPAADVTGGDAAVRALPLRDAALCTSGDYRNGFTADGRRVHHVFDPRTGANATHAVVSASILAERAAVADALGTAALVLGPDGTKRLWPRWQELGARAALLLAPGRDGAFDATEISWPADDS